MPMERERYPKNWDAIARDVKDRADWKCQRCGKQCRRPGEPFDTHKRTLTVAHLNHTPEDCRPENLMAMCGPCLAGMTRNIMPRRAGHVEAPKSSNPAPMTATTPSSTTAGARTAFPAESKQCTKPRAQRNTEMTERKILRITEPQGEPQTSSNATAWPTSCAGLAGLSTSRATPCAAIARTTWTNPATSAARAAR